MYDPRVAHPLGRTSRRRWLLCSAGVACLLILAALSFVLRPAGAGATVVGCGLLKEGRPVSAKAIGVIKCYADEIAKAIENDNEEIASGLGFCLEQEESEAPDWVPVEKSGENLIEAVKTNIEGQRAVLDYVVAFLKASEDHYPAADRARISLSKAIRDLEPYLDKDLLDAEKEATAAGNALIAHACGAVADHSLNKEIQGIHRDSAELVQHLTAVLKQH
jgi:hypothetical protein